MVVREVEIQVNVSMTKQYYYMKKLDAANFYLNGPKTETSKTTKAHWKTGASSRPCTIA